MKKNLFIKLTLVLNLVFYPYSVFASQKEPNDEYFEIQKDYFSQIKLQEAWSETIGSENVVIAVIDSGVDMDHPDIIGNIWFNRKEIPLNGIDDDNNGYIDDFSGWDFLADSPDPHPKFDEGYSFVGINHGTAVSGIAASSSNNTEGLSGVCWNCKIMALRAMWPNGLGDTYKISKAIDYAVDNGADIINMSFVGSMLDDYLKNSITRAYEAGVVLVAAVGNDAENLFLSGGDLDFRPAYPVCLDGHFGKNNIIGVGSVNRDNTKSSFSNYGFSCIDISAPGNKIAGPQVYDPTKGEDYSEKYISGWSGTSVSTPIVSGVVGLIKSANPKLTNDQIISIIRQSGVSIDSNNPLYINQLGSGLLDAKAAVSLAKATIGEGVGFRSESVALKTSLNSQISKSKANRNLLLSSFAGRKSEIVVFDESLAKIASWAPYGEFFTKGSFVFSGDMDGDGNFEIISVPSKGGGPQVRVFDEKGNVKSQFFAFDKSLRGGIRGISFDYDGDGKWEIVISYGFGSEYEIKILKSNGEVIRSFKSAKDREISAPSLCSSDVDGDGKAEIIAGSGQGSLPLVTVFDMFGNIKNSFLAYDRSFSGGVEVACFDINGDGKAEIITGAGKGGGPQVRVFDEKGNVKSQFFAFDKNFRGGITVVAQDIDYDGKAEIITGSGKGSRGEVRVFEETKDGFKKEYEIKVFEDNFFGGIGVGI